MQVIKPIHNSEELKNFKDLELEKFIQIKNDKYHVIYNILRIVFILPYLVVLKITYNPFISNFLKSFNKMIEAKMQINDVSRRMMFALLGLIVFGVVLSSYFIILFKLTYLPIKLIKKYWIKRKLWIATNGTALDQLNKCISTMLRVEEITILPQHILDETDVYKETDRLVFKIKENGYITEKTLKLDDKLTEICKPERLDFSSLDIEIDLLIERIKNESGNR